MQCSKIPLHPDYPCRPRPITTYQDRSPSGRYRSYRTQVARNQRARGLSTIPTAEPFPRSLDPDAPCGCYAGSTLALGHPLAVSREYGETTVRYGTTVDGEALGSLYDRLDGTLAQQRRAQHAHRHAIEARRRIYFGRPGCERSRSGRR